jgi:uncharacterized damage-inducible protein DinB
MKSEFELFMEIWEREAAKTRKLFDALPVDGYDFRPDPDGRSIGEMAWHIPEAEAYGTFGIERGGLSAPSEKPPGIERPKSIQELGAGYARVHGEAVARVQKLQADDLDRPISFFGGAPSSVRDVLWDFVLLHGIHHRGQLGLLARQYGGQPTGVYGPTREVMPLRKPTA